MKIYYLIILSLISSLCSSIQAQTILPYEEDFETVSGLDWILSNGSETNKWFVGPAVSNGGVQSLYISDDAGVSNNYTTSSSSVVHAYQDFDIPLSIREIDFSFDWKADGESCCDYLRVWIVPSTFSPTPGAQISVAADRVNLFGNLNQVKTFKREQILADVSNYTGSFRIVFEWRNDGSVGTQPPAIIDNILIEPVTCYDPIDILVTVASNTTADVIITPDPANVGNVTYEYEVRRSGAPGSGNTGLVTSGMSGTTTFTITGLQPTGAYTIYVRTICSSTDRSTWAKFDFTHIYAIIPYTQDFEGVYPNWILLNGNSTNQWVVGSAVANGGTKSLYISDDNGVSNKYNTSATTVVHAYKDFTIPANVSEINLEFDWKAIGEGTAWDYLRVLIVPSSFTPTVGTLISTSSDRIDLFGNLNQSNVFKREQIIQDISGYSGSFRVVFEWRNDGSGGSQPPGAIDNIEITPVTCSTPKDLQLSNVTKDSFTVTFTPPLGASINTTYEYEVRTLGAPGSGGTGLVVSGTSNTNSFDINGLQPSTSYLVYIKAICSTTDESEWTKELRVRTSCDYPNFISAPDITVCGAQKVDLTAIFDSGTVFWFDAEEDGNLVHTGSNFTTPMITSDTSYWVTAGMPEVNSLAQIGDGTLVATNVGTSLYHVWGGYKHQYIVTATELISAGFSAGDITAIEFDVASTGTPNRNNFSLSLGSTTQNNATNTPINNDDLTEVYSNTSEVFTVGIKRFDFTTPYAWDGVSNIVVQTNWSNQNTGGSSGAFQYHTTTTNMTTYTYGDDVTALELLTGAKGSSSTSQNRPNMTIIGKNGCSAPRIEVLIKVEPKPAFELSTYKVTSCEGEASELVTITTNFGNYDTFAWTPSAGVSGDAVNGWTFSTTQEQEYVLSAKQSNGICEHLKTVIVFRGKKPIVNPNLSQVHDICKNSVMELKVLETLPNSVDIGDGLTFSGVNDETSAFVHSAEFSKQQYIYSANELINQGVVGAGYITGLSFNTINSGASMTNVNYKIKMMMIPNQSFSDDNFITGNFTTVYTTSLHTHTFQGWQDIDFDNPFYWDGQSNIIVQITQEGVGTGNNNAQTYYTVITGNNVGVFATSKTDADPVSGVRTGNRLNVRFSFEQSFVSWSPASDLFLDAAASIPYTIGLNASTVYTTSTLVGNHTYTALIRGVNGCSTTKSYTINVIDINTPVVQNQTFCQSIAVNNIVVSGHQGAVLKFYDSLSSTSPITNIYQSGTYYVEAVQGACKSPRVAFNITIITLSLPTAQFTQVICGSGTVGDLVAKGVNGSQIKWYATATSTTALLSTQALVNNTTYYVSQELNGCESGRVAVLVNVNPIPVALTSQSITVCGGLDYGSADLNQTAGSELVWYQSLTSQNPIPNTTQITSGTYYVSQKINGCESTRTQIIVAAQSGNTPTPIVASQTICGGGTVAQLVAQTIPGGIALWYSSSTSTIPLNPTEVLVNGTYYVAQRVGNCLSAKVAVAVRVGSTLAPNVSDFNLCDGATVADLHIPFATGTSYKWYLNSTTMTELPLTDILKTGFYFVTKVENGCESSRTQVKVTINSRPTSPTGGTPQLFQDYAELNQLIMDQSNITWYLTYDDAMNGKNPLPHNMPLVNETTYYAVIIGTNGCPSLPTPIEVVITLGVNDFDLTKLKYHPNPVDDILTISYIEAIIKVEIFDLNGRMVINKDFNSERVQLDFNRLSSGTYMLKIQTKENSQFVKIVKK